MSIEYIGNDEFILTDEYGKELVAHLSYDEVEHIIKTAGFALDRYYDE